MVIDGKQKTTTNKENKQKEIREHNQRKAIGC